jgi:twitching motility protein PilT
LQIIKPAMAAIDSLLTLIDAQQATGIVLRTREAPVLVGGKGRGLTMPPLDRETMKIFAAEVLTAEEYERLTTSGACDSVYRSERHGVFTVETRLGGDSMSLKLRRGGAALARAAAVPAPVPPPAAPAAPPAAPAPRAPATVAPLDPPPAAPPPVVQEERPRATRLAGLIARTAADSVSDILLSAGQPLWIRSADGLTAASATPIGEAELRDFVDSLLDPTRRRALEKLGSVDLPWEGPAVDADGGQRFRINVFTQAHGLAVALRPISRRAPSLAELNLPPSLGALANASGGLVLVVGPTGAGKSTTLAAILETVNRAQARHVITLEDPIEVVYQPRRCLIHQREVGTHVKSFSAGLRAALRECPDIILVGEMRDRATTALALTAAETGHLVLSTLHSGSAPMAIDRIVDIFPEHQQAQIRQQLAGSLRAVLTQQLLPGASPGTRFPAVELLVANYAVGALIREGKTHQLATQIQTGRDDGMIAFEASLVELVRSGQITREVALAAARTPADLQRRLQDPTTRQPPRP